MMKKCTKCMGMLEVMNFHKDISRSDGYRDQCRSCVSTYMKANHIKNKVHIIAKAVEWVKNNRDKHNKKCNLWAKTNPEKVNARTAKRHAAKLQRTPKWVGPEEMWLIKEAYALAKLRGKILGGEWEVDHIIPLQGKNVCGLHVPTNLQVIPCTINRQKSNRYEVAL